MKLPKKYDFQEILKLILKSMNEGRNDAYEEAAQWHDERGRNTPDVFEQEFHKVSADAIRALKEE